MDTEESARRNRHARRAANAIPRRTNDEVSTAEVIADRIVREPECHQRTGLSRTTRWRLERAGKFPRRRRLSDHPEFRQAYADARDIRAGIAFPEQIVDIASNDTADWNYNPESGKLTVNKEAMLRSKLKIEVRQWHASRRHPQDWGDRQQIDVKSDYSSLSEDERIRKAMELIGVIKEITGPRPKPPALRYDPGTEEPEPEPEPEPRGIGG